MNFKIDTKEKFSVLLLLDEYIADNMSVPLKNILLELINSESKNLIVNLQSVVNIDRSISEVLIETQMAYTEQMASFVVCNIHNNVLTKLKENEHFDFLNYTPTESEAWDIVQMEEIERELLDEE
jgi:anti-anti-sigma regulatory factor